MRGKDKTSTALAGDRDVVRESWQWFLGLGIVLILLGVFALGSATVATLASILVLGWALIIGGALQTIHAFWRHRWNGFFIDLASGVLYLALGVMTVTHPLRSAVVLSLVIAVLLTFHGAFLILAALSTRLAHRLWVLGHGVITLALGVVLWLAWPESSFWMLGVFVGVDLLLEGVSLALLALATRGRPERPPEGRPEERAPVTQRPIPAT